MLSPPNVTRRPSMEISSDTFSPGFTCLSFPSPPPLLARPPTTAIPFRLLEGHGDKRPFSGATFSVQPAMGELEQAWLLHLDVAALQPVIFPFR